LMGCHNSLNQILALLGCFQRFAVSIFLYLFSIFSEMMEAASNRL